MFKSYLFSLIALVVSCTSAAAQSPDISTVPRLDLSTAQTQTIYQSISKTAKNNASPIGFRPAIGAVVPVGIVLEQVPATIAELMPQTKSLQAAMVEGEVILVDPSSSRILTVIPKGPT
jgi:hypothetical protein